MSIGGYAVCHYGYVRSTGDLDVWIAVSSENAQKMVDVLSEFGFQGPGLAPELFLREDKITRLGVPPLRLEIHTGISGVEFEAAYSRRVPTQLDGVDVQMISLEDLKSNKRAAGRTKDQVDLENLS